MASKLFPPSPGVWHKGCVMSAQRFCEPVEKSNSSHSFTAGLADTLGLRFFLTPLTFTNTSLVVLPLYLQLLLVIWI